MNHTPAPAEFKNCSIVLLAGGRGLRMGGQDKGWLQWQGQALIEHLYQVVRPLTDDLIISCNRNRQRYGILADQLIHDPTPDFPGPLIGIIEAMKVARHPYLIFLPCDAPRIDRPLLEKLYLKAGPQPAMLKQGPYWQPLFSILPKTLLPALQQHWNAGQRSPKKSLLTLNPIAIECSPKDTRLTNFNEPSMLV